MDKVVNLVGNSIYLALALVAAWGVYCGILAWMRISQRGFASGKAQDQMLDELETKIHEGESDGIVAALGDDPRALAQLTVLALRHRQLGLERVKQMVVDRFQQDVLADLETKMSWINTVIKSAPMLGLLGTVLGMMGAFGKLATAENVKPDALAQDISLALITTALGLIIAIPLIMAVASLNIRIGRMETGVAAGLNRLFEILQHAWGDGTPSEPASAGRGSESQWS